MLLHVIKEFVDGTLTPKIITQKKVDNEEDINRIDHIFKKTACKLNIKNMQNKELPELG